MTTEFVDAVGKLKWIAVALQIGTDKPIRCPFCEIGDFLIFDSPKTAPDECWVACPTCDEQTTIRITK
jgi:hypothetical protein